MALSTVTPTVTDHWYDGQRTHVVGTLAIGASPLTYQAGGIVINFNVSGLPGVAAGSPPSWVDLQGIAGFTYAYTAGTGPTNGLLQIFVLQTVATNAPLLEYSAVAISAALSGDTVKFHAIFKPR